MSLLARWGRIRKETQTKRRAKVGERVLALSAERDGTDTPAGFQDGRDANQNRHEPLNWNRVNWFCEPNRMKRNDFELWTGLTGVKCRSTEKLRPPF